MFLEKCIHGKNFFPWNARDTHNANISQEPGKLAKLAKLATITQLTDQTNTTKHNAQGIARRPRPRIGHLQHL